MAKYEKLPTDEDNFYVHRSEYTGKHNLVKKILILLFLVLIFISMWYVAYLSVLDYISMFQNYKLDRQFTEYTVKFNKSYRRGSEEYEWRFKFFKESLKEIDRLNRESIGPKHLRARYAVNQFSDLHRMEFKSLHLGGVVLPEPSLKASPEICDAGFEPLTEKVVDWRARGAVGPVQQQGSCGGCWAFSAVGVVESFISIKRAIAPPRLSVQQVMDCIRGGNEGCGGGSPAAAMSLMFLNYFVMMSEAEYPLTLQNQACKAVSLKNGYMLNARGEWGSCVGRELAMARRVAEHGPVTVTVNAMAWQHYDDGVIQNNCGGNTIEELNHAVQVVGYDAGGEVPYYIVRNSWGAEWNSLGGYAYIAMYRNECGVAWQVAQPKDVCWASADGVCFDKP